MASSSTQKTGTYPMVTGLFRDREGAERAYRAACDRGYKADDINLAMSDETRKKWYPSGDGSGSELGSKALEGTGAGAAIGGGGGGGRGGPGAGGGDPGVPPPPRGGVGALAAIGTNLVLPGLGLVVVGPLAAGLAGAGAGGLTGGAIGALVGWGIPEERAKTYKTGLQQGGAVMGVNARSEEDAEYLRN